MDERDVRIESSATVLHNRTTAVTTFSKHGLSCGIIFGSVALLCVGQAADKNRPSRSLSPACLQCDCNCSKCTSGSVEHID